MKRLLIGTALAVSVFGFSTGVGRAKRMRYITLSLVLICLASPGFGQEPRFGLSDWDCGREVLISVIEGAHVYASCVSAGPERVGGFVVRLKPGWKRSRSDSAWWGESKNIATITTHDC